MNVLIHRTFVSPFFWGSLAFFFPFSLFATENNNPAHLPWHCTVQGKTPHWSCKVSPPLLDTKRHLSQALGWIPDTTDTILNSTHPNDCSTCGGHYDFPSFPNPEDSRKPIDSVPSNISADTANYHISGEGTLSGNVKVIQPGRILSADTATIYQAVSPGEATKKVNRITAQGNLSVRQPDTLVLADHLDTDLFSHKSEVTNAHYLWHLKPGFSGTLEGDENFTGFAHGAARTAYQRNQNIYDFYNASYATCPPESDTWELHANHIQLNRQTERGYATNVWLTAHQVPVFYTPYFSFPLDKERQSGFLYGSFGYSAGSGNGASLTAPYYFNIAPNYDDTLTPTVYQQRGLLLSNEARFLTEKSSGELDLQYIYDQYNHESRGATKYTQNTQLSPNWTLNAQYNYLSDKEFLSNFSNAYAIGNVPGTPGAGLATQNNVAVLPRDININYSSPHWSWQNNITQYQIVDKTFSLGNRPYNLLPQSTLNGTFVSTPESHSPFDLNLFAQFTNFQKSPTDTEQSINGQRLLMNPKIDLPFTTSYGFITPGVTLNTSTYELQNTTGNTQFTDQQIHHLIPQLDVRSGVYLDRNFNFLGHEYSQTLEPQVMYLFTPNVDQNNIPSFDTSPLSFDYSQLFAFNRFSGYDRIGDTNQLSYALETHIHNDQGAQLFQAGIGQIYYFTDRHTTLCSPSESCILTENPNYKEHTSPVAAQTSFALNRAWNLNASDAYDPRSKTFTYQNYGVQYIPDSQHIFNLNYTLNRMDYSLLTRDQILEGLAPPKSEQITTSAIWKFTPIWHLLGDWDYSLTHQKTVSEFAALEYNQCCFAIELGIYRYLLTNDPNNPNNLSGNLQTSFIGQILLKGLGGIGENNFEQLAEQIPGYSAAAQI